MTQLIFNGRMNAQIQQCGVPVRPKSKRRNFDSAVALFTEWLFYSESLLVSALIKITILVENPSRPGRRELPIGGPVTGRERDRENLLCKSAAKFPHLTKRRPKYSPHLHHHFLLPPVVRTVQSTHFAGINRPQPLLMLC